MRATDATVTPIHTDANFSETRTVNFCLHKEAGKESVQCYLAAILRISPQTPQLHSWYPTYTTPIPSCHPRHTSATSSFIRLTISATRFSWSR
ncbi:hypothetical protein E2C01_014349 [Portunus trituberculatus]|uniref:Uncharacterized protein n=1 Tax=Portunus trituberculatus TaxID=210409 RepID=A0A5B7DK82_PORTR|nr:hypothetical protein [Portunus trituberculatus]